MNNANNNMSQNYVDLGTQNGAATYDINSLIDDDFEVIGSLSDALHSLSPENGSEIPLHDIQISNNPNGDTAIDSSTNGAAVLSSNAEAGDRTPLANNSLNLTPNGVADQTNTEILMQTVNKSSIADGGSLSVRAEQEDPISTVESIRADYQAAQQLNQQENELLRKACEKKSQQIEMLRRCLDNEAAQKVQLNAELEEAQRALSECRIKVDEAVASTIEREDIIKVQQATIQRLQNNGDLSCLPTSVINEQALISSLHEKEQLIEGLNKQLQEAEERYEREHKEVLDLEEIVKILQEYVQNNQQAQVEQLHRHVESQLTVESQNPHNDSTVTNLLTR